MAAKKLIQGLQERSNEASKKQIIKLASTYGYIKLKRNIYVSDHKLTPIFHVGLVSPFTSFVAVDRRNPDKTLVNLLKLNP